VYSSGTADYVEHYQYLFLCWKAHVVDLFCYREKESSDEGTQESIKVRENIYKKKVSIIF